MSELELGSSSHFHNLKRDTKWNISNLHNPYFDKEDFKDDYKELLERRLENPTRCDIAVHEELKKCNFKDSIIKTNIDSLKHDSDVFELSKQCDSKLKSNYPVTRKIREKLIDTGRLSLDRVTPKASKFQKFIITLKTIL